MITRINNYFYIDVSKSVYWWQTHHCQLWIVVTNYQENRNKWNNFTKRVLQYKGAAIYKNVLSGFLTSLYFYLKKNIKQAYEKPKRT
jgi:hypothetical protein